VKGTVSNSLMKKFVFSLAVLLSLTSVVVGLPDKSRKVTKVERSVAVDQNVTVTLCVMSGEIKVRGWDKSELRASSVDAQQIDLRRVDPDGEEGAAKRIDVFIKDRTEPESKADCHASADVVLDVPRGATVQVQTRDGNINIIDVQAAYAGSQNGDICIERVAQRIEAGSIGGGIWIKDSRGRVSLSSAGGGIEATNVNPLTGDDNFEVVSVSGDVQLEGVSYAKLSARSVTGNINLEGALASGGSYEFNTMSGDVTLLLPAESSFRLVAKVSHDGEIITDFPVSLTTETIPSARSSRKPKTAVAPPTSPAPPKKAEPTPQSPQSSPKGEQAPAADQVTVVKISPMVQVVPMPNVQTYGLRRVTAVCGSGEASISVSSFSGTLRLNKN